MFKSLFDKTIDLCRAKNAKWWLAIVSFTESSFFLIPPDFMLAPMTLANKEKWFLLATITTVASVLGGILGYYIGYYFIDVSLPYIQQFGYEDQFETAIKWFEERGVLIILIAGFTPLPYKIFTIASGAFGFNVFVFILLSFVARGSRFYLVAFLVYLFGDKIINKIYSYIDIIGWIIIIIIGVYLLSKQLL